MEKKVRESGIELLRIICMFLVVASHYVGARCNQNIPLNNGDNLFNCILLCLTGMWGRTGVNIFVLISGYFLCSSSFSLKKLVKIIFQVFFYSITFYIIFELCYNKHQFSWASFISALFPISSNQYWFITTYVALYLIFPFLNVLINALNKKQHFAMILLLLIVFSVIPTISFDRLSFYPSHLGWFIALYFISAFIKKYPIRLFESKRINLILFTCSLICCFCWTISWLILASRSSLFLKAIAYATYLPRINNIIGLIVCISLFNIFRKFKFRNYLVNLIASTTFGVYIIHCSPFFSSILWDELNAWNYTFSTKLIIYMPLTICFVFVLCLIIDLLRQLLIEKPFFKIINKPLNFVDKQSHSFFNKIFSCFIK